MYNNKLYARREVEQVHESTSSGTMDHDGGQRRLEQPKAGYVRHMSRPTHIVLKYGHELLSRQLVVNLNMTFRVVFH